MQSQWLFGSMKEAEFCDLTWNCAAVRFLSAFTFKKLEVVYFLFLIYPIYINYVSFSFILSLIAEAQQLC